MLQSKLVTKTRKLISNQETSINAQLLERAGFISKLMAGVYSFLPLGLKVLAKIENIVRQEMDAVNGQEILMPALQPKENWAQTGRWDTVDVLYKLTGAGERDLALGPTHEEIVTPLIGQYIQSYKDLPAYVYQIQTKFRNEARPKSGLLRGREFRMKDLYSFHATETDLDEYYNSVQSAYDKIFTRCGLGNLTYFTYASGGTFSKYSHEFQTITQFGEDLIYVCDKCKVAINQEIIGEQNFCPDCKSTNLDQKKSIEVGNIFKLKTRFTEAFDLKYTNETGKLEPVIMGCYGLGTTRLMGAIVEVLHDERGIIWPKEVAPFRVHLISLLKDATHLDKLQHVYSNLLENNIEVLLDDREISAGEKFADSDLIGIPYRVVISPKTLAADSVELKVRGSETAELIKIESIIDFFKVALLT